MMGKEISEIVTMNRKWWNSNDERDLQNRVECNMGKALY